MKTLKGKPKRSIEPIYHPYWLWEETQHNMWGKVDDREAFLAKAVEFTGLHCLYGIFMGRVVDEWRFSCEHNLSQPSQNRRAWLGHAACALALRCPEDIVRQAWWLLTEEQRNRADMQAETFIATWEKMQCLSDQLEFPF